jgi:hypothetical protein
MDKNWYNKLLFGPNDVVGDNNNTCPSSTYLWNSQCCCGSGCCWDQCDWPSPPPNCIKQVFDSQWVFNDKLGYYQAYKYEGMGLFLLRSDQIQLKLAFRQPSSLVLVHPYCNRNSNA